MVGGRPVCVLFATVAFGSNNRDQTFVVASNLPPHVTISPLGSGTIQRTTSLCPSNVNTNGLLLLLLFIVKFASSPLRLLVFLRIVAISMQCTACGDPTRIGTVSTFTSHNDDDDDDEDADDEVSSTNDDGTEESIIIFIGIGRISFVDINNCFVV